MHYLIIIISFLYLDIPCIKGDWLKFFKMMYHGLCLQLFELSAFVLLDLLTCLHLYLHVHSLYILNCRIKKKYLYVLFFKTFNKSVFNLDLLLHLRITAPITEQHTRIATGINNAGIIMPFLCLNEKKIWFFKVWIAEIFFRTDNNYRFVSKHIRKNTALKHFK